MSYTLVPSLEHIALVKLSVMLWNQDDIKAELEFSYFHKRTGMLINCRKIEKKLMKKVSQLSLPKILEIKILSFVKSVGVEILKWKQYHDKFLRLRPVVKGSLSMFHWTPQGKVDEKKTAEALLKDGNFDIPTRYELACRYCLENDIRELWSKLPERLIYYYEEMAPLAPEVELVIFWTYYMKGDVDNVYNDSVGLMRRRCTSSDQYRFESAVSREANKTAISYFLQKLSPEERAESMVRCAGDAIDKYRRINNNIYEKDREYPKQNNADVLCFLLLQMNEEERTELFRNHRYKVLDCFLNWPWQNLFMGVANGMWVFFSEDDFFNILSRIVDKIIEGHTDFDYHTLFGEVWQHIPTNHRRYVADACIRRSILEKFFEIRDVKNIKSILKHATPFEKKHLIFSGVGKSICEDLVSADHWHLLEFFVGQCISMKIEMMCVKAKFKVVAKCCSTEELPTIKDKWDRFFQLLDDFIRRYDKRKSVEEGDNRPAKKFLNVELEKVTLTVKK